MLKKNNNELVKYNRLILKSQQRLIVKDIRYLLKILIKLHWVVTMMKEHNQLIANKLQTYAYGTSEGKIHTN